MKTLRNRLLPLLAMTLGMLLTTACVSESAPEMTAGDAHDGKTLLVLRIGALGGTRATADNELIHSLRAVIVSDNIVEYNEKIYDGEPALIVNKVIELTAGKKEVYLIANTDNLTIYTPESMAADAFFDSFPTGSFGFSEAVNGAYFMNTYLEGANSAEGGNTTLLPLTAEYDITALPGGEQQLDFWLVKGATKYSVNIVNNRSEDLYLEELSISSVQNRMFLIPQVGSAQHDIGGYYWIDWLQQTAEESNQDGIVTDPGNTEYNDRRGWITAYSVPPGAQSYPFTPVSGASILIPGQVTNPGQEPEPGTATLGPFYSTEGKNPENAANPDGPQHYTLQLKLIDTKYTDGENREVTLTRVLPNLSALFRNTHVVINIGFSEGFMHVYAEIRDWEQHSAYGSATEEK